MASFSCKLHEERIVISFSIKQPQHTRVPNRTSHILFAFFKHRFVTFYYLPQLTQLARAD